MSLNADVVVLSGCQTALGEQVRRGGSIGLARAFMSRGRPASGGVVIGWSTT